jgi:hypothetical protein
MGFRNICFFCMALPIKKTRFAIGATPKLEICKNANRRNAETGKLKKTAIGTMPKQIN